MLTLSSAKWLPLLIAAPLQPQLAIERLASEPTRFGTVVDGAGDTDMDGFGDVVLGAVWDRTKEGKDGRVVVFSGKTGEKLHEVFGEQAGAHFGFSVSGAGDANADGARDFIVGAPLESLKKAEHAGVVRVYSGRNTKVLLELEGEEGDYFGWSVRGAGDVDQDGFSDLVVGAPRAMGEKKGSGRVGCVRVFSGKKGKVLHEWYGDAPGDLFGSCVDSAGDVDGDGSSDLVATALSGEYVRIFSGRNGKLLHEFKGEPGSGIGWIARRAGDTNQSGASEVVLGFPSDEKRGALVLAPKKGKTLWTADRPDSEGAEGWSFGASVDGAGDVNADGFRDVVIGDAGFPVSLSDPSGGGLGPIVAKVRAPQARAGYAVVLSGKDGKELQRFEGDKVDDFFGVSVSGAGDCNSDGSGDVVVAAGKDAPFHARLYSGLDGRVLQTFKIE